MCRIAVKKYKTPNRMMHGGIGLFTEEKNGLSLEHVWLPIQADPMFTKTPFINVNKDSILFNGEMFGHEFEDDLQLIYNKYVSGELFEYVRTEADGFWSMIIVRNDKILAFSDPLGKKQLYYKQGFGIASEIRELVTEDDEYDKLNLSHTIKFGYVTDDSTPYRNIKRIIPNKLYEFDMDLYLIGISTTTMVDFTPKRLNKSEFLSTMDKAVKNRLAGHKKVALLLSGGLDSSILRYHLNGVNVCSYVIDNDKDVAYARLMDEDVELLELIPESSDDALIAMEMPVDLGSMLPQYSIISAVEETVIMTGDGADEIFGGYKRMYDYDSQYSDLFEEIPYYHNVRLDRMASWFTKEIRSPFLHLDIVRHGLSLDYKERIDKQWLRDIYRGLIPNEIIDRTKTALKSEKVRKQDPILYRADLVERFTDV